MHEVEYIFNQTVDLSEENKTYTITVTVNLADDENASNNSQTVTVTHLPNSVIVNEINPLKAWITNDILYINGLKEGDSWYIYSVIGQVVSQGVARNETVSVKLGMRGVYIFKYNTRAIKVMY
jgi:hypothetical protein